MNFKAPPSQSWKVISELRNHQGAFDKFIGKADPRLGIINELKKFLCPGIIPHISFLLFDSNIDLAQKAADMITSTLLLTSNSELMQLDEKFRTDNEYQYSSLRQFEPKDFSKILRLENSDQLVGLCTFFPNGYLREFAIKELTKRKSDKALRYILLRLNDWVTPIRIIAKTKMFEILANNSVGMFLSLLDIVERMYLWGRDQHDDVIEQIERQLTRPENEPLITEAFSSTNFRARRFLVRIISGTIRSNIDKIIDLVQNDEDLMVRYIFLRSIKENVSRDQANRLVDIFIHDRLSSMRRLCIEISIEHNLDQTHQVLSNFVFDNNRSVRESSRWHLEKKYNECDFRSIYLKEIDKGNYLYGCILGIGEVGEGDDAILLMRFLDHQIVKIRKAAFTAIASLSPSILYDDVLRRISFESPSMVRCMADFISENFSHFSQLDIWELALNSKSDVVKTSLFMTLISRSTKWKKLIYLLKGAENLNEPQVILINDHLHKWLMLVNRSFSQPQAGEIEEIKDLVSKSKLNKDNLRALTKFLPAS